MQQLVSEGWLEPLPRSGWRVRSTESDTTLNAHSSRTDLPAGSAVHANEQRRSGTQVAVNLGGWIDPRTTGRELWSARILQSIQAHLLSHGMDMLVTAYPPTESLDPHAFFNRIDTAGNLAGVILIQPPALQRLQAGLDERDLPWVVVNRPHLQFPHNFVSADNLLAGRMVGRAFACLGYQRVLVLGGRFDWYPTAREKFEGFCSGYAEVRGDMPEILRYWTVTNATNQAGASGEPGEAEAEAFWREHGPPQGIFATGDYLALNAMRVCQRHGVGVPDEVGVVGASGYNAAAHFVPSLTTVGQPMEKMGAAAAQMLLHMAQQNIRRVPGQVLPGTFTLRDSLSVSDSIRQEIESFMIGSNDDDAPASARLSQLDLAI